MISKITSQILGKGTSRLELRRQIFDKVKNIVKNDFSKEVSPIELDNYIEKIARYAHKVTDQEIAALKSSGMSEDEIFELSVVAAFSAGETRVKLAMDLLKQNYET